MNNDSGPGGGREGLSQADNDTLEPILLDFFSVLSLAIAQYTFFSSTTNFQA